MELKLKTAWDKKEKVTSSNRTFMELKSEARTQRMARLSGSNRTFMELKYCLCGVKGARI